MPDIFYNKIKEELFIPVLFSNRKKIGNGIFEYACTTNTKNEITYQFTGINIIPNENIPWVYWECDGFFKRATISQTGLLTIQKSSSITADYYSGTVKVRNESGFSEIFVMFLNTVDVTYPLILSWNNYSNNNLTNILNSYNYYSLTGKNNNTDEITTIDNFYLEVDDNTKLKSTNIAQVDSHLNINGTTTIYKYIKFENLYNFETDSYSGDLLLNYNSYKFALTDTKKSYFMISDELNNYPTNEEFRYFTYKIHYDKDDYNEIISKYAFEEDFPYVEFYNKIIKNNLVYNTSSTIKKYLGVKLANFPKLNIPQENLIEINNKSYDYVYIDNVNTTKISYIINGDYLEVDDTIQYVNWYIDGISNDANPLIQKNQSNQWELTFNKIKDVYEYKTTITVKTNFGESAINVYFYIQENLLPILESNIIYDSEENELYKTTSNTTTQITYQMTGENITVNNIKHLTYVNWSIEGFNNLASIDNNGLITIIKDPEITIYEGTVTVENNFGSYTQYIKIDNAFGNIYPVKLSWNEEVGLFNTTKNIAMEINDNTTSALNTSETELYYIELDNEYSFSKITNISELNDSIQDIANTENNCESKIWVKWNNILESTTNTYSGDVSLNDISNLIFRPTDDFTSADDTDHSYFKISKVNDSIRSFSYQYNYNRNDISIINNKYKSINDLPYIFIYNTVSKSGYYYNSSTFLKLIFGFMINESPELTYSNNIKKINGVTYDYKLFEADTERMEYVINGNFINEDDFINNINWNTEGFNNARANITKNELDQWVLTIDKLENDYHYKGKVSITNNYGISEINIYLEVKRGLKPYLENNIEYIEDEENDVIVPIYKFDTNDNIYIKYQITGENITTNSTNYITFVNWNINGFENCATINNSGLITITKNPNIYRYEGTVTCQNDFGSHIVNIIFDDIFTDIYNIPLSWNEEVGIFENQKTISYTINNNTNTGIIAQENIEYYIEVDNNSTQKLNNSNEVGNKLPIVQNDGSTILNTYITWNNIIEFNQTNNENNGDYILNNRSQEFKFALTNTHKSYFVIRLDPDIYGKSSFRTINYYIYYDKNDFNELFNTYSSTEDYPYIEIYKKVYKCGYYYNTSTKLKLNIGFHVYEPPKLYVTGTSGKNIVEE